MRHAPYIIAAALALAFATAPLAADRPASDAPRKYDADDTGRNVRDRQEGAVTPTDQGSSTQDVGITRQIRQAVTGNDQLSTNAQNVKIVTRDGVVTLRGPVKSESEKSTVVAEAWKAPGVRRVDDQLEIERKQ